MSDGAEMKFDSLNKDFVVRIARDLSNAGMGPGAVGRDVLHYEDNLDSELVTDDGDYLVMRRMHMDGVPGASYLFSLDGRMYHLYVFLARKGERVGWRVGYFQDVETAGLDTVGLEKLKAMLDFLQWELGYEKARTHFIDSVSGD